MKIIHVIPQVWIGNGAAKVLLNLVKFQKNEGNVVDVVALENVNPSLSTDIINWGCKFCILSKSRYNPMIVFKLREILNDYDIVHVHLFPALYWVAIAKKMFGLKCQLLYTEHSTENNRQNKRWLHVIERYIYNCYDKIVAISRGVADRLQLILCLDPKKITVIYNGIDLTLFSDSKAVSRSSLGLLKTDVLIIQVSRFYKQKDQKTLIRALTLLPNNYHVVFVGDGELLNQHRILANELNVNKRVHFLGLRKDVPSLLKMADVVVQSSNYEGFGLAALEGMAAGKSVIASNVVGLNEIVHDVGLLFTLHDEKELALCISQLMNDESFRKRVENRCIEQAKLYSLTAMARNYKNLYVELLGKK